MSVLPGLLLPDASVAARSRPNVILVMADDVSAKEFGVYGHPEHRTPNLDRMAKAGVYFRTAWATPICSPTRAMLMTGRYAHQTRWFHNNMKPSGEEGNFFTRFPTIGTLMKDAGYQTAIVGKWQLAGTPEQGGFGESFLWLNYPEFDGPVETEGMVLPGRTARYWHPAILRNGKPVDTGPGDYGPDLFVEFIREFTERHRDEPFFVYYPMCLPHVSWDFDRNRHDYLPTPVVDEAGNPVAGERSEPTLAANMAYIDVLLGRIEQNLREQGLLDDTIIIFTGDNGTAHYGKGSLHQERGPRVPFVVYGPGQVEPRGARDELIDLSDVFPTLADLAGTEPPEAEKLDGQSFAWILRDQPGTPREFVFCLYGTHPMVRTSQWLLDGQDRLWFCGDRRGEQGYVDMTGKTEPGARAARERLRTIASRFPIPPEDHPLTQSFREYEKSVRLHRAKKKALREKKRLAEERDRLIERPAAGPGTEEGAIAIIPRPVQIVRGEGSLALSGAMPLHAPGPAGSVVCALREALPDAALSPVDIPPASGIILAITSRSDLEAEGYRLQSTPSGLRIEAQTPAGLFYGIQTLRQLIREAGDGGAYIPCVDITDYPRFAWRGMMLDVSRHFFDVGFMKRFIDLMALQKFNTFHWHLTDDQGWRIEIDAYPRLAEVGSIRLHKSGSSEDGAGGWIPYGGFYTKEEIREVVAYAAERFITVVPEIDMPGHAQSVLAAYPHLGCTGGPYVVPTAWGPRPEVLCAGNEQVYPFMEQVLTEVMELFPSKHIHIGADEVKKERWEACAKCQARIAENQLGDENGLQSYFVDHMVNFLAGHDRTLVGWDEILDGGVDQRAAVMQWRTFTQRDEALWAAQSGHHIIRTPSTHTYLDHYQVADWSTQPRAIRKNTDLAEAYSFEPVPETFTPELEPLILGLQGNLWTAFISTPAHALYMAYPRATALAEVAWSPKEARDFDDFLRRLDSFKPMLDRRGVPYHDPVTRPVFDGDALGEDATEGSFY